MALESKTASIRTEAQLQAEFVIWFKNEFRSIDVAGSPLSKRLYMVHNDGKKNSITASQDLARGLTKGVLDLNLDVPANGYHGLRIEWKKPGGTLAPEQRLMIAQNEALGYKSVVVDNVDMAKQIILEYLPSHLIPAKFLQAS